MNTREHLIELLATYSVKKGLFTLASGRISEIYVDARLTTMRPEGLATVGPLALQTIREAGWKVDSIGGLTLGADPIAYAISYTSTFSPPLIRAFTVRKEAKTHGTTKLIEGPFQSGDSVVVIEDVITTGGSALRAANTLLTAGARISGILAVLDREEGGREILESHGHHVMSLVQLSEVTSSFSSSFRHVDSADE